jgi:hypothetical protein
MAAIRPLEMRFPDASAFLGSNLLGDRVWLSKDLAMVAVAHDYLD